ncbi:MAG: DUF945 family protein [Marinobacter sp.]
MKRQWIMASAGLLVVAGIALPYGTGYLTEQQWQRASQEVNGSQTWLEMQVGRYDRGFWSSEFEGTLSLRDPASGEELSVPYLASVSHGVTGSLTEFKPVNGWTPKGESWFGDDAPRLTAETRLWGSAVAELTVPKFNITNEGSAETIFGDGGVVRVKGGLGSDTVDISADWPSLVVASEEADIRLGGLTLEQEMQRLSGDVWIGEGTLALQSLELTPANADAVMLRGLSFYSNSEAVNDDSALDSFISIKLDELQLAEDTLGPHRIEFVLKGLNVDAWNAVSRSVTDMQLAAFAAENGDPTAFQQQMQAMSDVGESMQMLAAAGFSVGFPDIHLVSPDGPLQGKVLITHPGATSDSEPLLIMPALEGEMELSIPLALAENNEDVRMQTAPLIKDGLLITEGDRLFLRATLKDLVLNVNGRPIPLPPLL